MMDGETDEFTQRIEQERRANGHIQPGRILCDGRGGVVPKVKAQFAIQFGDRFTLND